MGHFRAGLIAAALATAVGVSLAAQPALAQNPALAQSPAAGKDQVQGPAADQAQNQAQVQTQNAGHGCPGNPDALGTSRVLPIDFSEYQQLGRMQYPDSLPLNDKEVVITFDDGPLPPHTDQVLDILGAQCVKATFFMVGEMARAFPATVRRVYEEGHTIGTHSDHHPTGFGKLPSERMHQEIDGGIADVSAAFGGDPKYLAPFFRIPGLERSDLLESELAARELIIFSSDVVADDWHRDITPAKIIALAISRLEARGKGILLLHDIHPKTVAALPGLLDQLKAHGFHVVQVVPSAAYEIAMANRPAGRMLASAMPGELLPDAGAARPAWPQAADQHAPDDIVMPVPDAASFEPDAGLTADNGEVRWPDLPEAAAALPAPDSAAPGGRHHRTAARSEHRKLHLAHSVERSRPEHRRGHARAAAGGHHADLMTRIHAVAALFSPAQTTR
jgi:peptidoglycan/xylan/chitin deacetylase (PgdA/CDA1 family)